MLTLVVFAALIPSAGVVYADSTASAGRVEMKGPALDDQYIGGRVSTVCNTRLTYPYSDDDGNMPFGISTSVQVYQGSAWQDYDQSTFAAGTYRLKMSVYTNSGCDPIYVFSSKVTITYNGNECTYGNRQKYSLDAYTESFTVKTPSSYALYIAGTQVTDANAPDILGNGVFSYDKSSNTLFIDGDYTYDDQKAVESIIDGLTINAKSDSVITGKGFVFFLRADTKITGSGKLTVRASSQAGNAIQMWDNAKLTIENADLEASGRQAIQGTDGTESLTVVSSNVTAKATGSGVGAIYVFKGGITLEGCGIAKPSGGSVGEDSYGYQVVDPSGNRAGEVRIVREYDLKIERTKVTDDNAADVLGDGVFKYDAASNTLTVNGNYKGSTSAVTSEIPDLTVVIAGDSDLHNTNTGGCLDFNRDTTITGSGKLTLTADRYSAISVINNSTVTIDGVDIIANGNSGGFVCHKELNKYGGKLIVKNSNITVKSNGDTLHYFKQGIELTGCSIRWPKNYVINDGTVYMKDGVTQPNEVVIARDDNRFIMIGDYVRMGTNYSIPMLWRCVDIDENGPLMLAEKIIAIKPYDAMGDNEEGSHGRGSGSGVDRKTEGSNYWGDSNLRCWLNSYSNEVKWACGNPPDDDHVYEGWNDYAGEVGFLRSFNEQELAAIKTVTQKSILDKYEYSNTANPNYHTYYGGSIENAVTNYDTAYSEPVTDTVFLLDVKQLETVYKNDDLLGGEEFYLAKPAGRVVSNSEYKNTGLKDGANWWYWLRTPEADYGSSRRVRYVTEYGVVDTSKAYVGSVGVRPAFYLDSDFYSLASGSGTSSDPYTISSADAKLVNCMYANGEATATVVNASIKNDSFAVLAVYDADGNLRDVKARNIPAGETTFTITIDADESIKGCDVKVFLWKDTKKMIPICDALCGTVG